MKTKKTRSMLDRRKVLALVSVVFVATAYANVCYYYGPESEICRMAFSSAPPSPIHLFIPGGGGATQDCTLDSDTLNDSWIDPAPATATGCGFVKIATATCTVHYLCPLGNLNQMEYLPPGPWYYLKVPCVYNPET